MTPLTREWVEKAEGDFHSAQRETRARRHPNYDSACFHAQQCVEKYLKARLQEAGVAFPKTHDLDDLLHLVLPVEPHWAPLRPAVSQLTNYAVVFRYPGPSASEADARQALAHCRLVRKSVRQSLGLKD
jgi:HEPN domain-containing protein